MKSLPHWSLTGKHPAFYDTESATAIEQTAKIYGAMQTLIDEYNKFVDELNTNIQNFEESTNKDVEDFKECITNTMRKYIETLDTKVDNAVSYMKTNLRETAENYLASVIDEFNEQILDFNETKANFEQRFEQFIVNMEEQFTIQSASIAQQNVTLGNAINDMNTRLNNQDIRIGDAVSYMSTNLQQSLSNAIEESLNNGEIVVTSVYNDETESLDFIVTPGGE